MGYKPKILHIQAFITERPPCKSLLCRAAKPRYQLLQLKKCTRRLKFNLGFTFAYPSLPTLTFTGYLMTFKSASHAVALMKRAANKPLKAHFLASLAASALAAASPAHAVDAPAGTDLPDLGGGGGYTGA